MSQPFPSIPGAPAFPPAPTAAPTGFPNPAQGPFPGAPAFPGAPQPAPAMPFGAPPGQFAPPAPLPGTLAPYAPPQAPPQYGAPAMPAQYMAPTPGHFAAPPQYGAPQQQGAPMSLPDLGRMIAESTLGPSQTPRLADSLGDYVLAVAESGHRQGISQKPDHHPYNLLWVDFVVVATTSTQYAVNSKVSTSFNLIGADVKPPQPVPTPVKYMLRRLKALSAGLFGLNPADPQVERVYQMIASNQLVGRQIKCTVYNGTPNPKTGKSYNEEAFSAV